MSLESKTRKKNVLICMIDTMEAMFVCRYDIRRENEEPLEINFEIQRKFATMILLVLSSWEFQRNRNQRHAI